MQTAARLVEGARHLLDLVKVDGSWGVHNPRYTQRLLEEAEAILGSGRSVFDAPAEGQGVRLAVAMGRRPER